MAAERLSTRCCIVGGGPCGLMLGFLLARAGVDVVVLEKHGDFLRDFRGDTIHPSTLDVMGELGLLDEFLKLPSKTYVVDISCVTKWTKLDMKWQGVSVDTLFQAASIDPRAAFITAYSYGDYTTNLPIPDLINDQAFIAYQEDEKPLTPEHGGPARLVVPHLYFWKSAKWIQGFRLEERERLGFWETLGYHRRGDPWKEERYSGD